MSERPKTRNGGANLEVTMRGVSQVVSMVAVALMVVGFGGVLLEGGVLDLPGAAVLSLGDLLRLRWMPLSLGAMSLGIALLAIIPSVRVLLAGWLYLRRRHWVDVVVALVLLAELLVSTLTG